jgi:hypothetical protein
VTTGIASGQVGLRGPGRSTAVAFGCLLLFSLPFAATGLFAAVQTVLKLAAGDWRTAAFMSVFALVFGGAGIGLAAAALYGRREAQRRDLAAAQYPNEPWLWRQDWASGRIEDAGRKGQYGLWIFAAFWNLISFPSAILALREVYQKGNRLALVALLFPVVGVGLIVAAVRATMRQRKFGLSSLELSTRPGVVGHGIAGTVRIASELLPADGFTATLTCVNLRTTGSGDDRSTNESIRWQEEQRVSGQRSAAGAGQGLVTAVSVRFRLPSDVLPTDEANRNDRIVWRLQVAAGMPGVDYTATFEVPVFRTAASAEPMGPEEEKLLGPVPESLPYRQPAASPIRVSTGPRGTQIVFPAARNPGAALGLTAFAALWAAIIWLIVHLKAPVLFLVAFGLVELAVLYGVLRMWLRVVEVTAGRDGITIASGFGAPGDPVHIDRRDIEAIEVKIGLQAGTTVYYDLAVLQPSGRRTNAGSGIRDKREAEWLAGLIRDAIGQLTAEPQRER